MKYFFFNSEFILDDRLLIKNNILDRGDGLVGKLTCHTSLEV